ncbi:C1q-related factor-like [Eucyclogobius newberryi]|uniref:C1q-related factor-like n=1 Tax=Eucyclogobius newberryi TaxID=166745 RepID=UPI003B5BC27C
MKGVLLLIALKVVVASTFSWSKDLNLNSWGSSTQAENDCETDSGSCQCCLMMKKVDGIRKNLVSKLDDLETEFNKTLKTYTDLTTQRSAFTAALFDTNNNNLLCLGPFSDTRTIKYKRVFTNLGNNYNSATGIYTAPFSGVYSISVSVFHDAGQGSNERSSVVVLVNGVMISGSQDIHTFDHEDSSTVSVTAHLNSGDRVEVQLKAGSLLCMIKDHYNVFSGFLLYAD